MGCINDLQYWLIVIVIDVLSCSSISISRQQKAEPPSPRKKQTGNPFPLHPTIPLSTSSHRTRSIYISRAHRGSESSGVTSGSILLLIPSLYPFSCLSYRWQSPCLPLPPSPDKDRRQNDFRRDGWERGSKEP
ncbi:uncharacterized protein LY89DRAFT_687605 [Mollisia scopiformis]|uniref:Uncharacterized protein n=1 Tax=Mollisia scopiformis TaxID=149040 RepID=A0A194X110_MOLSC|nr:uncharacterized protein LY89DRAFT_687605 [Mollisia scopiformis]KUJ13552.1 hypothetical protein LY89DRAFT_687605 [Mollisia scopiformis]